MTKFIMIYLITSWIVSLTMAIVWGSKTWLNVFIKLIWWIIAIMGSAQVIQILLPHTRII